MSFCLALGAVLLIVVGAAIADAWDDRGQNFKRGLFELAAFVLVACIAYYTRQATWLVEVSLLWSLALGGRAFRLLLKRQRRPAIYSMWRSVGFLLIAAIVFEKLLIHGKPIIMCCLTLFLALPVQALIAHGRFSGGDSRK
jgi:hypothetical protein